MDKKVNELLQEAFRIMGEDSDIMIISHKDGQCGAVIHGSIDNNARAIFACIHQPNNQVGKSLYRILKLNVLNLLNNMTPFAGDLVDSIDKMIEANSNKDESNETEDDAEPLKE